MNKPEPAYRQAATPDEVRRLAAMDVQLAELREKARKITEVRNALVIRISARHARRMARRARLMAQSA